MSVLHSCPKQWPATAAVILKSSTSRPMMLGTVEMTICYWMLSMLEYHAEMYSLLPRRCTVIVAAEFL